MVAFAVSGADLNNPFDPNLAKAPQPSSGTAGNPSITFSITGTDDMLIGYVASAALVTFGAGSGLTVIDSQSATLQSGAAEYETTTTPGSYTLTFSGVSVAWMMFGDALVSPSGVPEFPVGLIPLLIAIPVVYILIRRTGQNILKLGRG
jgi:hypothetical protein